MQEAFGQTPQVILTMPILEGYTQGNEKMSKSLDNYIGITEPATEIFGKIMSIDDEKMWRYFELLSFRPMSEINQLKQDVSEGGNPREAKIQLAFEIVERFYSKKAARKANDDFINRFSNNAIPDEMPEIVLTAESSGGLWVGHVLKRSDLTKSTSEAKQLLTSGAVRIDGEKVTNTDTQLDSGVTYVVSVGKRKFTRVKLIR